MDKHRKVFKNQRVRRMLVMVEGDNGSEKDIEEVHEQQNLSEKIRNKQTNIIDSDNDQSFLEENNLTETSDFECNNIPSPNRRHPLYLNYLNEPLSSPSTISNVSTYLANIDFIASPKVVHKVPSNVGTPSTLNVHFLEKSDKTLLDLDANSIISRNQNEFRESVILSEINDNNQYDDTITSTSPSIIQIPVEEHLQSNDFGNNIADSSTNEVHEHENLFEATLQDSSITANNILEESSLDEPPLPLSRKRARREKDWIDRKNKRLKNSGKSYLSVRSKKSRPAKTIKNVCSCSKQCYAKINDEERQHIFNTFWKLADHEHQWHYILRYVKTEDVKKIKVVRKNNRTQTITYYLPSSDSDAVQVCKKFFINTLSISEKMVYTALEKGCLQNDLKDNRGHHSNRPRKMDILTETSIVKHIKLFPVKESHYIRQQSKRLYLSENLNISEMYRLYTAWFKEKEEEHSNVKIATKRQYETVFNMKFNYSFFKPKKDRCATCVLYEEADDERKVVLETEYQAHRIRKDKLRAIKKKEKEEANSIDTVVATFDLEKVLNVPQSNVGIFHYKRKYPIYNFTIHNSLTGKGHCYVWHYEIAKRGAIEIGSCLLKFIVSEVNKGIKTFSFYSDSCAGQNKNRYIFSLYVYLAQKYTIDLTHKFFEVGHSQSEGDSIHSCIERAKHNKIIYTPEQMYSIILNAKKSGEKYELNEMSQDQFVDIKTLTSGMNWTRDSTGNKIFWSKIKEVSAKGTKPGELLFKYDFDSEYLTLLTQNKPKSRGRKPTNTTTGQSLSNRDLLPVYHKPLPISKALHDDLMSLCNCNAIPPAYQEFYKKLQFSEQLTDDCNNEDNLEALNNDED